MPAVALAAIAPSPEIVAAHRDYRRLHHAGGG
jgi:hypothetical protein